MRLANFAFWLFDWLLQLDFGWFCWVSLVFVVNFLEFPCAEFNFQFLTYHARLNSPSCPLVAISTRCIKWDEHAAFPQVSYAGLVQRHLLAGCVWNPQSMRLLSVRSGLTVHNTHVICIFRRSTKYRQVHSDIYFANVGQLKSGFDLLVVMDKYKDVDVELYTMSGDNQLYLSARLPSFGKG